MEKIREIYLNSITEFTKSKENLFNTAKQYILVMLDKYPSNMFNNLIFKRINREIPTTVVNYHSCGKDNFGDIDFIKLNDKKDNFITNLEVDTEHFIQYEYVFNVASIVDDIIQFSNKN